MSVFPKGAHIVLKGMIRPADEGGFVASAAELGIATQGESVEEARDNLAEAIEEFIDAHDEFGTLEAFLRERNIPVHFESPPESEEVGSVSLKPGEFLSAFMAMIGTGRALHA